MKQSLFFLFAFFTLISINAQKINSNYIGVQIDSVYLFSPFGYVLTFNNSQKQISPEFTKLTGDTLSNLLFKKFPAISVVLNDSMLAYDYKTQDNVITILDKLGTLNNDVFSKIQIGVSLDSIIKKHPGRYYGFIHYNGFMNTQVKRSIAASITLMVLSTVITAGMVTTFLIPVPSELDLKLLVIDKRESKFVYYCDIKLARSFSMNINKQKLVDKTLKDYKKTFVNKGK